MASSTLQSGPQYHTSTSNPNSNPNSSSQNLNSRKRALDHAQSSPYFKMRALLRDLRPLFLEVLHAPEFRGTEAANGIQEKMNLMVELCKQMATETPHMLKCNNGSGTQTPASRNLDGPIENHGKAMNQPQSYQNSGDVKGSLTDPIVGGSAFGWNFLTFTGSEPLYYGRSKESFRAAAN